MKRRKQNERINAYLKTRPAPGEIKEIVLRLESAISTLRFKGLIPPKDLVFMADKLNGYLINYKD